MSFLGEPFWIPATARPLGPRITIRMERDASDSRSTTAAFEFRCTVRFPQLTKIREERSRLRQVLQQNRQFIVKPNQRHGFRLFAEEAYDTIRPVNVSRSESGHVRLRRPNVPAKFVECPAFRVGFRRDNSPVLVGCDAPLFAVFDLGPASLGEDRPRQPIHVQSEIMQLAEMDVCGDGSLSQCLQKMLGTGFPSRRPVLERSRSNALSLIARSQRTRVAFFLVSTISFITVCRVRLHRFPESLAVRVFTSGRSGSVQDRLLIGFVLGVEHGATRWPCPSCEGFPPAGFYRSRGTRNNSHGETCVNLGFHTLSLSLVA